MARQPAVSLPRSLPTGQSLADGMIRSARPLGLLPNRGRWGTATKGTRSTGNRETSCAFCGYSQLQAKARVYLQNSVGPEQNFTYIAALQPKIAFIIDRPRLQFGNCNCPKLSPFQLH